MKNKGQLFLWIDEAPKGPFTLEEIERKQHAGEIPPEMLSSFDGQSDWKPFKKMKSQVEDYLFNQRFEEKLDVERKATGPEISTLRVWGSLFFGGGLAALVYCLFFFDYSIAGGFIERTVNLGLMSDRQSGVIASCGIALIGAVFLAADFIREGFTKNATT